MPKARTAKQAINLPRVIQKTDSHCGPAVVQELLAHVHRSVTQDQVVEAARNRKQILERGTRPKEIARAVAKLAPKFQFWFKQYATIEDLDLLINQYHWPVGINWQGLFYDTPEQEKQEDPHGDHGHYSVVIKVNPAKDLIVIADTYKDHASDYTTKPRKFSLSWFETRWWDTVHDKNRKTGKTETLITNHLIFIITPKKDIFPQELGMLLPDKLDILKQKLTGMWLINQLFRQFVNPILTQIKFVTPQLPKISGRDY